MKIIDHTLQQNDKPIEILGCLQDERDANGHFHFSRLRIEICTRTDSAIERLEANVNGNNMDLIRLTRNGRNLICIGKWNSGKIV